MKKTIISVCIMIFFGTFFVANKSMAADAKCICYEVDTVLGAMHFKQYSQAMVSSDETCNTACKNTSPLIVQYSFNGSANKNIHDPIAVGSSGQIADTKVPGTTIDNSGIIKCGRPGQEMCTLCDLIAGMNNIIQYLMKIAVGVALLAMTIGGVMYVISAGDGNMTGMAKKAITNAAIGFVIIFAAYLIINTLINYIGTKPGMGINITSWGNFTCSKGLH
ncbi:MAG: pilin [bacterium]